MTKCTERKRKPITILICMIATSVFLPRCSLNSLSLQQIRSFSSLESTKTVQIFLYASQGEANVCPIFTRLLGTSRSFLLEPTRVLQQVCFDSWTLQFIQAFELIWWGCGGEEPNYCFTDHAPRLCLPYQRNLYKQ